ncbi:MAG: arginine deiminase-related protein [Hyphomicrobium sp.]|jgi:N-dimethylarginine dimethylaminohydrolase
MTANQTILMCEPGHFSVDYVINPWMENQTGMVDRARASRQWERLRTILSDFIKLAFVPSQPGVPDMVFTANAGLVHTGKVIVSRFASQHRRAEEPLIRAWFEENGYAIADWPQHVAFEGAGDALFDRKLPILWFGHGFRSDAAAAGAIERAISCRTVALRLVDPRFYHLDTCLCPLEGGWLLYYPGAFDQESLDKICALVTARKRIEVDEADALQFACNAVNLGKAVILNHASEKLIAHLRREGFDPMLTPLCEFLKSGGAAKCLTLKLSE